MSPQRPLAVLATLLTLALLMGGAAGGQKHLSAAVSRSQVHGSASLDTVRLLSLMADMYASDNGGYYPDMSTEAAAKAALFPYARQGGTRWLRAFLDPADGRAYQPNPFLSRKQVDGLEHPERTVEFYKPEPLRDGYRAVCFADIKARFVSADQWRQLKKMRPNHHLP